MKYFLQVQQQQHINALERKQEEKKSKVLHPVTSNMTSAQVYIVTSDSKYAVSDGGLGFRLTFEEQKNSEFRV